MSLADQRELKTDEERKRKVIELVEEMSEEQTFGRRLVLFSFSFSFSFLGLFFPLQFLIPFYSS